MPVVGMLTRSGAPVNRKGVRRRSKARTHGSNYDDTRETKGVRNHVEGSKQDDRRT